MRVKVFFVVRNGICGLLERDGPEVVCQVCEVGSPEWFTVDEGEMLDLGVKLEFQHRKGKIVENRGFGKKKAIHSQGFGEEQAWPSARRKHPSQCGE